MDAFLTLFKHCENALRLMGTSRCDAVNDHRDLLSTKHVYNRFFLSCISTLKSQLLGVKWMLKPQYL